MAHRHWVATGGWQYAGCLIRLEGRGKTEKWKSWLSGTHSFASGCYVWLQGGGHRAELCPIATSTQALSAGAYCTEQDGHWQLGLVRYNTTGHSNQI